MKKIPHIISALIILAISSIVWAASLNTVEVPIANPSYNEVVKAFPKALASVLIKVSGNTAIMTLPQIKNATPTVNTLVQSYSYTSKLDSDGNKQLYVKVTFDKKGIANLLNAAKQPVWVKNRPTALVWMTVDEEGQPPYILASGLDNDIAQLLQKDIDKRGLKIVLPALDLEDQNYINTDTSQLFDQMKLQQAAKRYGVDVVLAANVKQGMGQWDIDWLMLVGDQPFEWKTQASMKAQSLDQGINNMANIMVNQFSVSSNQDLQTDVSLEVVNINDLTDYAKLLKYIRELPIVNNVDVKSMTNSRVVLDIKLTGGEQALVSALAKSAMLQPVIDAPDKAVDLSYQWVVVQPQTQTSTNPVS